jgi:hypothetical protein
MLKDDPSLRYHQAGRDVLRWFESHVVESNDWSDWLATVPPHCVSVLLEVALSSRQAWQELAIALKKRADRELIDHHDLRSAEISLRDSS